MLLDFVVTQRVQPYSTMGWLWNIRLRDTIREKLGSRTRRPGTSSGSVPPYLVYLTMNNIRTALEQTLQLTLLTRSGVWGTVREGEQSCET